MTQETNQNQSFASNSEPVSSPSQESSNNSLQDSGSRTEKMLPQHKVDEIVREVHTRAYEKGRNEILSNNNQNNTQSFQNQNAAQKQSDLSPEYIRQLAAEEIRRQNEEFYKKKDEEIRQQRGTEILNQLVSKFQNAEQKYQDFNEKVSPFFNPVNAPVFGMLNDFENSADIAYEFSNRPHVLADIKAALELGGPQVAYQKLKLLSESIKFNEQASTVKVPNQPLSQIKSSPGSSASNGSVRVSDFRKMFARQT